MAAAKPPKELHLYKYDIIRSDWTRYFERQYSHKLGTVKEFFNNFHRNHPQLEFTIAKIFDGSTQIFVDTEDYAKIKKELEKKTGRTPQEARDYVFRNGIGYTFVEKRSFASWGDYREYSVKLESKNEAEKRRWVRQLLFSVMIFYGVLSTAWSRIRSGRPSTEYLFFYTTVAVMLSLL